MTLIVGITGGIASGKTTVSNFLKKKKYAVHESDAVVKKIYSKPAPKLIKHLKQISLSDSIKKNKINKVKIRKEIFNNKRKKMMLEKFIHKEVRASRNEFLKKHKTKKTKIVFLDIPLLFEGFLEKKCNKTIFLYTPLALRKRRALNRKGMQRKILEKIIKSQLNDKTKKLRADYIVNTSKNKNKTFKDLLKTINIILEHA